MAASSFRNDVRPDVDWHRHAHAQGVAQAPGDGARWPAQRRKKSAAERRAQRRRSEARTAARLFAGLCDVASHRGGALSVWGQALHSALANVGSDRDDKESFEFSPMDLDAGVTLGESDRHGASPSIPPDACMGVEENVASSDFEVLQGKWVHILEEMSFKAKVLGKLDAGKVVRGRLAVPAAADTVIGVSSVGDVSVGDARWLVLDHKEGFVVQSYMGTDLLVSVTASGGLASRQSGGLDSGPS